MMRQRRGFTLIEMLIVVGIISLFVSIIIASTSGARARARDSRRYADLTQIGTALESYYQANYGPRGVGSYPSTAVGGVPQWQTVCAAGGVFTTSGATGYVPNLAPTYIASLPTDPLGCPSTGNNGYQYISDGNDYKIMTNTTEQGLECYPNKQYYDPKRPSPSGKYCALYTPGAATW